jgi:4-hydroxy-2-oxoheptanedioate aldolase
MKPNPVKAALASGGRTFGSWSMMSSPTAANVMAEAGLDFVVLDLEHGPASFQTIEHELYAIEAGGAVGIVRLPDPDPNAILRALEVGASGLLVSHVSSPEAAAAVVKAAKYPPDGERGLSPFTRNHGYSEADLAAKLAQANERLLLGVLVEGPEGLANLDAIAETPGLDVVYVGVYDLSLVAGVPGELDHPKVLDAVRDAASRIDDRGRAAGSVARDRDYLRMLGDAGFRFLTYRCDSALLRDGLAEARGWYEELP